MTKTSWIHREKRQIPYMNVKVKGHVLYSYVQFGSSRSWSLISGVPRNILEFYSFGICRYPRTGVPPLAVTRQGSCSYPWLHPNSRTPMVRSPVLPTTVPDLSHGWERSRNAACPGRGRRSARTAGAPDLPWRPDPRGSPGPLDSNRTPH